MATVSEDGYVRLSLGAAKRTSLVHLISGLDDELEEIGVPLTRVCGISGYTEWVSVTEPIVSLGWDWQLDVTGTAPRYVRVGMPRTNLMLLDGEARDLGEGASNRLIEVLIDSIDWQGTTAKAITERYA